MLTRARLRDEIVRRTGYRRDVIAHVLDEMEKVVRDELVQQGEVMLRGLFRVVPVRRPYARRVKDPLAVSAHERYVDRLVLTIRPVRALRKALSAVVLKPR